MALRAANTPEPVNHAHSLRDSKGLIGRRRVRPWDVVLVERGRDLGCGENVVGRRLDAASLGEHSGRFTVRGDRRRGREPGRGLGQARLAIPFLCRRVEATLRRYVRRPNGIKTSLNKS